MKKIFSLTVVFLLVVTVSFAQTQNLKTAAGAIAKWGISKGGKTTLGDTHDFGVIPAGTPVSIDFVVKNTGTAPLILSNVQAACGCTTPEWTKDPIAPGKTGTVKATFNAAAVGTFNKGITINSNASEPVKVLYIKGEVKMQSQNN